MCNASSLLKPYLDELLDRFDMHLEIRMEKLSHDAFIEIFLHLHLQLFHKLRTKFDKVPLEDLINLENIGIEKG